MSSEDARSRLTALAGDSLELRVLSGISRVLVGQREVGGLLEHILQVLEANLGITQGALCLLQGDVLVIEASYGLSDAEKARGTYHLGEGSPAAWGRQATPP